MSIFPLQQFEADLKQLEDDRAAYEKLSAPDSIVVRFGTMRLVGEFPYSGDSKPGCGSKLVCRTHRGTELGEMLTSTCPNAGCGKSVSRKEMLEYIDNSGGKDYPFHTKGRVLRVATIEDMNQQSALEGTAHAMRKDAQARADRLGLEMKIVQAEPILGGERLTFYFLSEDRVDFRDLVQELASEHGTRIEMRQIGARDEARLNADYERCGQHCCCKQFLKVLKPVSIRSAKQQKATLDPLKISGRCGRLMCCLRYEDETYRDLIKKLPKMKKQVGTPEGPGIVVDRQVLTQLVLVSLDADKRRIAVPIEELMSVEESEAMVAEGRKKAADALRGMTAEEAKSRSRDSRSRGKRAERQEGYKERSQGDGDAGTKKKRRRKRKPRGPGEGGEGGEGGGDAQPKGEGGPSQGGGDMTPKKKRRRGKRGGRRRKPGGGGGE
ncbi:MAG: regulatory iron-sulfur-containing complex subunit RicT [Phycisphaerales bacterium]